jgi:hypothetical protein
VAVSGVDIGAIELDKSSNGYLQLMAVTKELTAVTVQAQTAANVKNIHDKQRIEAENYQETLRVQREEGQYAQHKQTQTSNFVAYQTEAQTQVGVAGANALGQMGANGAGGVDLGGGGAGFIPSRNDGWNGSRRRYRSKHCRDDEQYDVKRKRSARTGSSSATDSVNSLSCCGERSDNRAV